jgi:hypothetical protein
MKSAVFFLALALSPLSLHAQSVCYASAQGKDSSSGASWSLAKGTVMGCYDSLPPEGGIIYISERTPATRTAGEGIWIAGSYDPKNYKNPPAGWRRAKGSVNFIGFGGLTVTPGAVKNQVSLVAGSRADRNRPAIWISGSNRTFYFENLSLSYPGRGIVIGETAQNVRTGSGSQNITFNNVSVHIERGDTGPAVDITGGSFWVNFRDCFFSANAKAANSDRAAAVLLDGNTGGGGSANFVNCFVEAGGIKFYRLALGTSGLTVHGLTTENLPNVPAVWFATPTPTVSSTTNAYASLWDIAPADTVGTPPVIQVDGVNNPPDNILVYGVVGPVSGSMTLAGLAMINGNSSLTTSPLRSGQRGIISGKLVAQDDSSRRNFPPTLTRFPNLADQVQSDWKAAEGRVPNTTPVRAPDGTLRAGRLVGTRPNAGTCFFQKRDNYKPGVGDWIIAGVWVRNQAGEGYAGGSSPATVAFQHATLDGSHTAGKPGAPTRGVLVAPWRGDGEWEWIWGAWKVLTSPAPGYAYFGGEADIHERVSRTTDYYAPVLLDIPAGAVSDNEAWEIALNLQSYRDDAVPGQVSLLRGEQFKADSIQLGDGPTLTSGKGPPTEPGSPGSIYLRRDGERGSTFYIYEKDGWKAQF